MRTKTQQIQRWHDGQPPRRARDEVVAEEPLELRVDHYPISVTMRTPGNDEELAAGFVVSEALVRRRDEVLEIRPYPRNREGNVIDVFLSPDVPVDFHKLTRHVFASSSCGLCGKATIASVRKQFPPVRAGIKVSARVLQQLPDKLRAAQETFDRTGGLHAAAVFDLRGNLVVLREDVGRHNAVDKVVGYGFLNERLPFDRHILVVSGRASFEIMQKALSARIPVVAAISAPSSLAVEFARRNGQVLAGFVREGRMNVYAQAGKVGK